MNAYALSLHLRPLLSLDAMDLIRTIHADTRAMRSEKKIIYFIPFTLSYRIFLLFHSIPPDCGVFFFFSSTYVLSSVDYGTLNALKRKERQLFRSQRERHAFANK